MHAQHPAQRVSGLPSPEEFAHAASVSFTYAVLNASPKSVACPLNGSGSKPSSVSCTNTDPQSTANPFIWTHTDTHVGCSHLLGRKPPFFECAKRLYTEEGVDMWAHPHPGRELPSLAQVVYLEWGNSWSEL